MPPRTASSAGHREDGTASVELIAVLPFLLLAVLVAAQVGIAGESIWSAELAARSAARAAVVGNDPMLAARRALPPSLRPVATLSGGREVTVSVAVPRLLPALPRITVKAASTLGDG